MPPGNRRARTLLLLLLLFILAPPVFAHPMGNFSISHYAGIRLDPGAVEIRYIIDMAEIPAFQEIQSAGITAREGDPSLPAYLARQAALLGRGLQLEVDHHRIPLAATAESVLFPPGAGGLPTMKFGFVYRATFTPSDSGNPASFEYTDNNFPGHTGWKEIVLVTGPGISLPGANPLAIDRSAQLSNYPTDLVNSPPQILSLQLEFTSIAAPRKTYSHPQSNIQSQAHGITLAVPGPAKVKAPASPQHAPATPPQSPQPGSDSASPSIQLRPNQQATPRSRFTELISSRCLSPWFLFTAALLAMGLGAMHALEPGHGKTIVAAYLVGSRGKNRHAIGLGLLVTASHTAGVYLLGAITLYASRSIVPEQLYPWLGITSGLIITALAGYLFLRTLAGKTADHHHPVTASHGHWFSSSIESTPAPSAFAPDTAISLRQLLLLGITGGIIPCPAALVVLLSALSLHRVGFGLFLIVAFSAGLAIVLISIGLLMVSARGLLARWRPGNTQTRQWITRYLPLISSGCMFCLGLGIAIRALASTGIQFQAIRREHLGPFLGIVLLGLLLGMRHSTDPDHVVAVSTIVSRERSIRHGALIGMLWGLGHTLTIFLVGAAIILFGLVIPPRIGLSMEFAVALMLILLGILNLTGILNRITARFTPAQAAGSIPLDTSQPTPQTALSRWTSRFGYYQLLRPLFIGLVHGLAGSAAVALLVLSMIHNPLWAIAYLLVFGGGTVIGMMIMTTALAVPIAWSGHRFTRATSYLSVVSGVVSMAFGAFLVYHIGFVDGLFTSHVHWTPQ